MFSFFALINHTTQISERVRERRLKERQYISLFQEKTKQKTSTKKEIIIFF